ncbi:MAG TPA: WYL domain-containing protein [Methylococcaceae bacterium]|nr:WYL domain-containing protein [Methylococcaceae bacterium]
MRSFGPDTVRHARALTETSRDLAEAELDAHFAAAYGIFSGPVRDRAALRFAPERARWVKAERWRPERQGETLPDGGYRLSVPYADERELLMDILRQGGASKWRRPSLYEDEWPMRQRLLPACIAAVIRSVHEARNLSHFTIG